MKFEPKKKKGQENPKEIKIIHIKGLNWKKKTIGPKKKKGQKNFYYMIKNTKINLLSTQY